MKTKLIVCSVLVFSIFLSGSSWNSDFAVFGGISGEYIPAELIEIAEDYGIEHAESMTFSELGGAVLKSFKESMKLPAKSVAAIAVSVLICAILRCFEGGANMKICEIVCVLAVSAAILLPVKEVLENSITIISRCSEFMLGFIPVYSSSILAGGYVSSAAGYSTVMLSAATAISRIASEILAPLVCVYIALCIAAVVSPVKFDGISGSVKSFALWIIGGIMAIFSGIMGLGTLVASSSDAVAAKAAKFLVGSAVPVVGSVLSDAFETFRGCISLTKNTVGVYGIIVLALIFLPQIAALSIWKICFSAGNFVSKIFESGAVSSLLSSASSVISIMLALVITVMAMFVFSVAVMLMSGGAA